MQTLLWHTEDKGDPEARRVNRQAPEEPNTFSDGGVICPGCKHFQVAGMGVLWPKRRLCEHPLSQAEETFAIHEKTSWGLRLWAKLPGFRSSSTRSEIAAAAVSFACCQPISRS